ncbi:hypothetical protein Phi4:1_gp081 [Cellulophaga phage phi4:1]|uniref:Uncharacterized protein n=3 Tax=Lightbulbvirus Cba41 TaxID=1918524 RepID=A0A0S2MWI9_9CAUD|nr:hypothetical protein Phi4:1_gp081 [Cellulophaga phage phi4:1]AGO49494.1 hypothetical protein Phi4:1_gp081 [Cellulophaga phage phi4:1]ALO80090.1 hypothetical protein Phi4113_081 [Cellulophaga phage phi4:1_13]ALO80287.1 hypothetical protein Phi4118_081 [Cellulophaga phage phi4:1_18]
MIYNYHPILGLQYSCMEIPIVSIDLGALPVLSKEDLNKFLTEWREIEKLSISSTSVVTETIYSPIISNF